MSKKNKTILATVPLLVFTHAITAFADTNSDLGLKSSSASEIGKSAINTFSGPLKIFGGVAIFFCVASLIFAALMVDKRPDSRTEIIKKIPWIAGCSFALGSLTLLAGFLIGLGGN